MSKSFSISESTNENAEAGVYQITVRKDKFNEFFASLLRQPRVSQQFWTDRFVVDHIWLVDLIDTIDQRVRGQSEAVLADFSATIGFGDNRSKQVSSVEAFRAFNDPVILRATRVSLRFVYLVHFPDRESPEKQEVLFGIDTSGNLSVRRHATFESDSVYLQLFDNR